MIDRIARLLGVLLLAAGLGAAAGFAGFTVRAIRAPEFQRARLSHQRNPGNVLYEAKYARHVSRVILLGAGAVCGFLSGVAGLALWLAGRAGQRLQQLETRFREPAAGGDARPSP